MGLKTVFSGKKSWKRLGRLEWVLRVFETLLCGKKPVEGFYGSRNRLIRGNVAVKLWWMGKAVIWDNSFGQSYSGIEICVVWWKQSCRFLLC